MPRRASYEYVRLAHLSLLLFELDQIAFVFPPSHSVVEACAIGGTDDNVAVAATHRDLLSDAFL